MIKNLEAELEPYSRDARIKEITKRIGEAKKTVVGKN